MDEELERALVTAEWSNSIDAVRLATEVRRLQKIEDGLKKIVSDRKSLVETLRAGAFEYDLKRMPRTAGFSRDNAERLMAEVWPLEALLSGVER